MFAEALRSATGFTYPYVALRQSASGNVYSMLGAFVVVNPAGWIVTSAHIVEELLAAQRSAEADRPNGGPEERVTQRSEIWALPGFESTHPQLTGGRVNPAADLAVGRLEPFDATSISAYPVLRDNARAPLMQGEGVCRYGFPFHAVKATTDGQGGFRVAEDAFPVSSFALDGIIARFNRRALTPGSSGLFIETSTPGLRGQSGGPLLDRAGRLCGIQSHTAHLDLGFDAAYTDAEGKAVTERQFLNVGLASHVDEMRALLDAAGATYELG